MALKRIVLTGGGTAGHVNPNLALVPTLQQQGWSIFYIGSPTGIEKQLVTQAGIPFYGISAGKLRRYWSWQNLIDPFKVLKGIADAYWLLRQLRPNVVFSKGGFVTVPVIWSASRLGIPTVIHESDYTPGLANRLALPFAHKICVTFPETLEYLGKHRPKAECTGLPIRPELLTGDLDRALAFTQFSRHLPTLLVMGGSTGAYAINRAIRQLLPKLTTDFQVIHLCGQGNLAPELADLPNYRQYEYLLAELPDIFALADIVVSRAGANAIFELLALRKPHILIPLPTKASRGDQILNAQSFASKGYSILILEEELSDRTLLTAIYQLEQNRHQYVTKMQTNVIFPENTIMRLSEILNSFLG
ncbi:MAG: undecaprenyldiphospho-muramoylpentapeptide beta-N-acetylglucosaminyltransferase [Pseudanabaenaceae cyanobacterium]